MSSPLNPDRRSRRPWWKKKRYFLPAGLFGALMLLGVIGSIAGTGTSKSTLAGPSAVAPPTPSSSPTPDPAVVASAQAAQKAADDAVRAEIAADAKASADAAAAAAAAKPKYAGSLSTDTVAANREARISGWTATATPLRLTPSGNQFIPSMVCTSVVLTNRDTKAQDYSLFSWKLQDSAGSIKDVSAFGQTPLGSGSVAPGGTARGLVCFDDPKVRGQTLLLWNPDYLGTGRAVWIDKL